MEICGVSIVPVGDDNVTTFALDRATGVYEEAAQGVTTGVNLVTDIDFDDDSFWSYSTDMTVVNGELVATGAGIGSFCFQNITAVVGESYLCTIVVNSISVSGNVQVIMSSNTVATPEEDFIITAAGTYTFPLTCITDVILIAATKTTTFVIERVEVFAYTNNVVTYVNVPTGDRFSSGDIDASDNIIYLDDGRQKQKPFSDVALSQFQNDLLVLPPGGAEGQVLTIVGGVATWV